MNHELYIKSQRLRWFRHLQRTGENNVITERSKSKWQDQVMECLKIKGTISWNEKIKDRKKRNENKAKNTT